MFGIRPWEVERLRPDELDAMTQVLDAREVADAELWAKNHGSGQRVNDLIAEAKTILRRYQPSALAEAEQAGT